MARFPPPVLGAALAVLLAAAASAQAADPPGASVDELLALARRLNPGLAAAALESEAALAKSATAGALDDPMLNLSRDQGFRQTLFTVSQEFPLWGKRALRERVAQAEAGMARAREGTALIEVVEQVKVTFAQYYAAEHALRETEQVHTLLHALAAAARTRYAQGSGSLPDALRAEMQQTRLDPERSMLERDVAIARAKINALVARPAEAALAAPARLRKVPEAGSLKLDELVARARTGNPMVAAARAEIAAAEGEGDLVAKGYYPDVTVTLGGDDLPDMSPRIVAGVGIKVPLQWGVREAQARAATAKKGAAQARLDEAMLKIRSELAAALASLSQTQRTGELLAKELSQQSDLAYRAALTSYQNGRGDLTPVLEAAHQELDVRLERMRTAAEEQAALAAIERLIGDDL